MTTIGWQIAAPINPAEKKYTEWQECARKDIERAFGILKSTWQFLQNPIRMMDIHQIGQRVSTALILHNMIVSDRVMQGDVDAVYNPNNAQVDSYRGANGGTPGGTSRLDSHSEEHNVDGNEDEDIPLSEREEHMRLQNAIKTFITK